MAVRFQLRRDTAANWTAANPTLALGEPGVETDTLKVKVGDGATAWNSLAYSITKDFTDLISKPTTVSGYGITDALTLTALSVTQNAANGTGALTYNNTTGVFEYTPPNFEDLDGNFTGSVFADDSTLLVDAVEGKLVGLYDNGVVSINNTNVTTYDLFVQQDLNTLDLYVNNNIYDGTTGSINKTIYDTSSGKIVAPVETDSIVTSTIDSTDSSAITITPDLVLSAGLTVGNHIVPSSNENIDLGSASNRFRDIYLSGSTINLGGAVITRGAGNTIELPVGTTLGGVKAPDQTLDTTDDATFNSVTGNVFTSLIDSADSSAITITPDVVMSAGLTVGNHIIPSSNSNIDLGSEANRFRDLYLSGNSAIIGDLALKRHVSGGLLVADHSTGDPTNITTHNITANDVTAAGDVDVTGNLTMSGYIAGPATFTIDPAAVGDNTGTVVIAGDLQVDGTTTTINSTTVNVDDLNIQLATGAINAAAANGAGITVDGANATLTYSSTDDKFVFNKGLDANYTRVISSGAASSPTSGKSLEIHYVTSGRTQGEGAYLIPYDRDSSQYKSLTVDAQTIRLVGGNTLIADNLRTDSFVPSQRLHVYDPSTAYILAETGGTGTSAGHRSTAGTNDWIWFATEGQPNYRLYDYSSSTVRLTVKNDGNVGIGTEDPSDNLTIDIAASNTGITLSDHGDDFFPQIKYDSNRPNAGQSLGKFSSYWNGTEVARMEFAAGDDNINKDDGAILFNTRVSGGSLTTKVKIDIDGSVGIGTTDPVKLLSLETAGDCGLSLRTTAANTNAEMWEITAGANASSNADLTFRSRDDDGTGGSEVLRLQYGGNVGIGTGTPGALLDVNDSGATDNAWNTLAKFRPDLSDANAETSIHIQSYPSTTSVPARKAGIQSIDDTGNARPLVINKDGGNVGIATDNGLAGNDLGTLLNVNNATIIGNGTSGSYFGYNAHYDGAWQYNETSAASLLSFTASGELTYRTAASGTAGTGITFAERFKIGLDGTTVINTTSDSALPGAINFPLVINTPSGTTSGIQLNVNETSYGYITNDATYVNIASDQGSSGLKFRVHRSAPDEALVVGSSGEVKLGGGVLNGNYLIRAPGGIRGSTYSFSLNNSSNDIDISHLDPADNSNSRHFLMVLRESSTPTLGRVRTFIMFLNNSGITLTTLADNGSTAAAASISRPTETTLRFTSTSYDVCWINIIPITE